MFLPKHPTKPSSSSSSNQQQGSSSTVASAANVSITKKRITPILVDTPPINNTTFGLTTQSYSLQQHSDSTNSSRGGIIGGLFRDINDDAESINSSSDLEDDYTDDEFNNDEEESYYSTEQDEENMDFIYNDDEFNEQQSSSIQSTLSNRIQNPTKKTKLNNSKSSSKTLTTKTIIKYYKENEIQNDNYFLTNLDISILFSSLSYSKRDSTLLNSYSFYYLQNDKVLYERNNRLHFGKLNKCEKVKIKITDNIINKFKTCTNLDNYPQIIQGEIKITQLTDLNNLIQIITPININYYFEFNNIKYIIITNKENNILLYPFEFNDFGKFLQPIEIYNKKLENLIMDDNFNLYGNDKQILFKFDLKKIISNNNSIIPIQIQINFKFEKLLIFNRNILISSNINGNKLITINNNNLKNLQYNDFNIKNEIIVSIIEIDDKYKFILSNNNLYVHNITNIKFKNNINQNNNQNNLNEMLNDDEDENDENSEYFIKMAIRKYLHYYLICTLTNKGIVDIYKFDDSIKDNDHKISLEFRFSLTRLSFFDKINNLNINIECEYLNYINSEIIICLKNGNLIKFKPYLFFNYNNSIKFEH